MFLRLHFELLHLFVNYCGNHKMAEKNTRSEHNIDENSDFEGYNNKDVGDNESALPDSEPDSSHIEVSSVGSSEVSNQ